MVFVSTTDDLQLRLKVSEIRCDAFLVLPEELSQSKLLVAAILKG
jgi:hypothetical protein